MIQAVAWSPVSSWILFGGRSRFGVVALRSLPDDLRGLALGLLSMIPGMGFALDDSGGGVVAGEFVDSVWRCRSGLYDPGGAWYAPPGVQKGC